MVSHGDNIPSRSSTPSPNSSLLAAQERLYDFLLEIVQAWDATAVLNEFKRIFFTPVNSDSGDILPALYHLLFSNQEQEFRNTLKRSCYILINNWEISRNYLAIQQLIQLFSDSSLDKPTLSPTLKRLRTWLKDFTLSSDFAEIQLFAERYENRSSGFWSHRYTSYLLVPQYVNLNNSFEQRQAARTLYLQLREKFKYELAMYTAHRSFQAAAQDATQQSGHWYEASRKKFKNPTFLGDQLLDLIQKILTKRGFFNYPNLARIFLKQTQDLKYLEFKKSLLEYLIFSIEENEVSRTLKQTLAEKLAGLYIDRHAQRVDEALILRTTNRVVEYLTTENQQEPGALFILLLSKGNALTVATLLLKLILICRYSRVHLETRIADLIKYYEKFPEEDCKWMIYFLEVFNLAMTIHTDNVEYNLVDMTQSRIINVEAKSDEIEIGQASSTYRIFSQLKQSRSIDPELDLLELSALDSLNS